MTDIILLSSAFLFSLAVLYSIYFYSSFIFRNFRQYVLRINVNNSIKNDNEKLTFLRKFSPLTQDNEHEKRTAKGISFLLLRKLTFLLMLKVARTLMLRFLFFSLFSLFVIGFFLSCFFLVIVGIVLIISVIK
jgi:hypothetical protein